jgi:hypothetical protein
MLRVTAIARPSRVAARKDPVMPAPTGHTRLQIAPHVAGAPYSRAALRDGMPARPRRARG